MYSFDWLRGKKVSQSPTGKLSPTVWSLGFTSLFTDISSEMVSSILPMYLVTQLGLSPLQFGVVDGLYQGVTALLRLVSGYIADRWRRHKETAIVGYGLSALCKLGLLAAGNAWVMLATIIALDRTGKGVRTAPRDALIASHSDSANLGAAFGVHRALDAVGALAGPAVAFWVLSGAPGAYDAVFIVSFCFAVIGLGVLTIFVQNKPAELVERPGEVSLRVASRLLSDGRFRSLILAGGLLSVMTMSDSFVYLAIHKQMAFNNRLFPLLYLGTALFYMTLAIPLGRLADRVGRGTIFIAGHVALLLVYTVPLSGTMGRVSLVAYLALFGAYYAATDGVLMAMAAVVLPKELYASGMAMLTTITSAARMVASVALGWLWMQGGSPLASKVFLAGLFGSITLAAMKVRWKTAQ